MYIGISTRNVWNRWFSSVNSHILKNAGGYWRGNSAIGQEVVDNMPKSLLWNIMLFTIDDWIRFCKEEIEQYGYSPGRMNIKEIEPIMIHKLSPLFNVTYNGPPTAIKRMELTPEESQSLHNYLMEAFGIDE